MRPCLRAERVGRWFSCELDDENKGHIAIVADDFITEDQAAQLDQDGAFAYEKETDSLVARIDANISPGAKLVLGRDAVVGTVRLRQHRLEESCGMTPPPSNSGLIITRVNTVTCKGIHMSGRHAPGVTMDILDVSGEAYFERENNERDAFFALEGLSEAARLQVKINAANQPLEVRFHRNGDKTASAIGVKMYWTDIPLEFQLARK